MVNAQTLLSKINRAIVDDQDVATISEVMRSGFLSKPDGGPKVVEFQQQMATLHRKKYAFAVNSGTSALHCAATALNLKPTDEVLVPALANIADPSVVIQAGGTPVFVDVDPDEFNIDPKALATKITGKTKAVIVVHMFGQPAKMDEIKAIADKHSLVLIEDCAQAAGARYKGRYVGSFGDISCFSTYQTKHIVSGEGGVVMTSDEAYATVIGSIANNGIMKEDLDAYDYDRLGFNYQMNELQGALCISQLRKLDTNNKIRRKNVELYKSLLADLDIAFQINHEGTENTYFYLTCLLPERFIGKRDDFLAAVKQLGAPIKNLYPLALNEVTLFKNTFAQDCHVAQDITKRIFNLYVNPGLEADDIAFIASAVRQAFTTIG